MAWVSSVPADAAAVWANEGMTTVEDLNTFYVNEAEVRAHLARTALPEASVQQAVAAWRDTRRTLRVGRFPPAPTGPPGGGGPVAATGNRQPAAGRVRQRPGSGMDYQPAVVGGPLGVAFSGPPRRAGEVGGRRDRRRLGHQGLPGAPASSPRCPHTLRARRAGLLPKDGPEPTAAGTRPEANGPGRNQAWITSLRPRVGLQALLGPARA